MPMLVTHAAGESSPHSQSGLMVGITKITTVNMTITCYYINLEINLNVIVLDIIL